MIETINELKRSTHMSKPPIVIYHGNCADGFSAAWVFWKLAQFTGQPVEFHKGVYGEDPPDVKDRVVYLVDFSYKREVVGKMLAQAECIILLDHHISALKDLEGLDLMFDNFYMQHCTIDKSGAMIAWDFLKEAFATYNYEKPLLLNHIEDRDLWKFKLPFTREISADVFSYDYTFENWDKLMNAKTSELLQMTAAGAAIERKHHKDIKELLDVCERRMAIAGYLVPCASLPYTMSSDACHEMARAYKGGSEFAACYWDTVDSRIFSLRSTDNGLDVSEIAATYGGGGHKHAAGFKVPREHILAVS